MSPTVTDSRQTASITPTPPDLPVPPAPSCMHACVALADSLRNYPAGMAASDLPEILCDAEAEYSRLGGWERVFPCPEEPTRCVGGWGRWRGGEAEYSRLGSWERVFPCPEEPTMKLCGWVGGGGAEHHAVKLLRANGSERAPLHPPSRSPPFLQVPGPV